MEGFAALVEIGFVSQVSFTSSRLRRWDPPLVDAVPSVTHEGFLRSRGKCPGSPFRRDCSSVSVRPCAISD